MPQEFRQAANVHLDAVEHGDDLVFLHAVEDGPASQSYGIQVARLAGVPKGVIERSKEILRNLEESELTPEGAVRQPARQKAEREKLKALATAPQMDLFAS